MHARRGNTRMRMVVGVTDGELTALVTGRSYGSLDGDWMRAPTAWRFDAWPCGPRCPTSTGRRPGPERPVAAHGPGMTRVAGTL